MKTFYSKVVSSLSCLATIVLVSSCMSTLTYNEAMQRNARNIEDSRKLEDARFMVEAASYNTLATRMAEAAVASAYSASVVKMARENLEAHQDMGKELRKLARKEDIKLPGEMSSEHERMLAELTSTDRREFDKAYLRLLGEANEGDREKFANIATEGQSEDIRAFAARKLDMFDSYRRDIQTVDAELLRTY